jgi:hypothetical protein
MSCEDQGYGLISDGCVRCSIWRDGKRIPVQLMKIDGFWKCPSCDGSYGPIEDDTPMNCSIAEPCYRPDCTACNPLGSIPSNMRFARYALSEIFKAKRQAYTGLWSYQTFPRDPRAPK